MVLIKKIKDSDGALHKLKLIFQEMAEGSFTSFSLTTALGHSWAD